MGAFAADHAAVYAGYNLFVKVSGGHAAGTVTTAILATTSLQTAALAELLIFTAYLFHVAGMRRRPKAKSFENSLS